MFCFIKVFQVLLLIMMSSVPYGLIYLIVSSKTSSWGLNGVYVLFHEGFTGALSNHHVLRSLWFHLFTCFFEKSPILIRLLI